jgi:hypothetical protein
MNRHALAIHRASRRGLLSLWFLCALLLLTSSLQAQRDERAVRAAFVYNLTKYVEWPQADKELVIGFVGEGGMGETLQRIVAGKTSDTRTLRVILDPADDQLERCDVVYVAYSSPKRTQTVLSKLRHKSTLSVGETGDFARAGGMVGLVRDADQIQIQVNLEAAQAAGLKISSRLLNLAVIVRRKGGS